MKEVALSICATRCGSGGSLPRQRYYAILPQQEEVRAKTTRPWPPGGESPVRWCVDVHVEAAAPDDRRASGREAEVAAERSQPFNTTSSFILKFTELHL